MKLSFYSGVQEIGCNKVFLGFGMSFSRHGEYFEEYLKPRVSCCMGDFVSRTH